MHKILMSFFILITIFSSVSVFANSETASFSESDESRIVKLEQAVRDLQNVVFRGDEYVCIINDIYVGRGIVMEEAKARAIQACMVNKPSYMCQEYANTNCKKVEASSRF